ncbi:tRNA modification GTPase [Mytilus galloprovincialis]|uniref:tRNA modification GTPase n=1 Tax=Mytilus galloprovincialis TaxID=29158 RepID=A0A8B6HL36_MYTGA|nr:tRNA modification GTPase [Mytilus galloprovincialis]
MELCDWLIKILPVLHNFRHISRLYILRSTNSRPVCHTVTDNYTRITQSRHSSVYTSKDTIFSLSSGHGKCGVAVIRVSGTKSSVVLKNLGRFKELPRPRYAVLRTLYDQTENIPIDHGLVLWFPAPRSFTGEDCVEFQIHGGPAVVAAMASNLCKIPGIRQAEAGEFTKRAFLNNKLDLTEIEGLGDLIHAETEAQRRQALRQMEGNLGKLYERWRSRIIKMMANVEAFIDFSEDENIEEDIINHVNKEVNDILLEIENHLHDNRRGERLRSGVRVTILGEPNVGKSSLLNLIAQRPAAIVSDVAGTTRDIVESAVNIGGYPVLLSDTAGLRESRDVIEKEGVRRALDRAKNSDLKVIMVSAKDIVKHFQDDEMFDLRVYIEETLKQLGLSEHGVAGNMFSDKQNFTSDNIDKGEDIFIIINKTDLIQEEIVKTVINSNDKQQICAVSCTNEDGITEFLEVLTKKLENLCGNPLSGNPSLTQARHRHHLCNCVSQLHLYQHYIDLEDVVLAAQSIRRGTREIGKITGKITSEDILDVIFKDFCIGK